MLGLRLFQCIIKVEAGFEPSRSRWSQLFHNHQPLRHSFLTSLFLIIQKKFGERLHRKAFSWCNYKWRLHSFFLSLCLVLNLSLFHTLSLTYTHSLSLTRTHAHALSLSLPFSFKTRRVVFKSLSVILFFFSGEKDSREQFICRTCSKFSVDDQCRQTPGQK